MTVVDRIRSNQFNSLVNLIEKSAASFIFIDGPADCGKTTILKNVTKIGTVRSFYIDSLECITMTMFYQRIISFLSSPSIAATVNSISTRRGISASLPNKPCSTATEFVTRLLALNLPQDGGKAVIMVDEADRLLQLDSNAFSVFLRLPEMLNHRITLILASRENFESFGPSVTTGLIPITFTLQPFSEVEAKHFITEQIVSMHPEISVKEAENCVQTVQKVANCASREFNVIRNIASKVLSKSIKNSSTHHLPRLIQESLDQSNRLDSFYQQSIEEFDFVEKYLLIAAYIASFQTSKDDCKVFGSVLKKTRRSKKLYNPAKDISNLKYDKLNVNLPKLFDQTRLLAIFYFIVSDVRFLPSTPQLQIILHSLTDRGLLRLCSAASSGTLKYRVNISKDFAYAIAEDLKYDLKSIFLQ